MAINNLGFIAQGWRKIPLPALSAKIPAANAPDFVQFADDGSGSLGVFVYAFDDTIMESIYMSVTGFKDYVVGTDIYPQVVWTTKTIGTSKNVCWGAELVASFGGGEFGATTTTLHANEKEGTQDIVAYAHNHTFLPKIDGSVLTSSDNAAMFRLFRDAGSTLATDDFVGDAHLIGVNILYYSNKIGEPTRY